MNPNAPAFVPSFGKPKEQPKVEPAMQAEPAAVQDSWEEQAGDEVGGQEQAVEKEVEVAEEGGEREVTEAMAKAEITAEVKMDTTPAENGSKAEAMETEEPETQEEAIIANSSGKRHVNLVFIGHVDAGKSTISGHILYLTGGVDERTMDKYEREAKALNRESWKYAWALDTTEQERNKGKTEECGRATFTTETKKWTILDAPGHKNFVPHMIGGASQADVAILVISARKGEFETGFEKGGQTREHAMLAKTSGVRSLIVVINKLDDPLVLDADGKWSKARFDECQKKLLPYLKQVGWRAGDLTWLPLSGITGENLKYQVSSDKCPWYKGESLLDTLEHLAPPDRLINAPVRLPIFEKYKEMGAVVMGKLESGLVNANDRLLLMPNKNNVLVESIQLETGDDLKRAEPGDNVRVRLKGIEEEDIKIGSVLCSEKYPIPGSTKFDVRLMILEHKSIITAGYSAVMHINSTVVECTVEKLLAVLDKKTGEVASRYPRFAKPGMNVVARISVAQSVCVEPFKVFAQLGRFMVRDEGRTIGVGVILKIRESDAPMPTLPTSN